MELSSYNGWENKFTWLMDLHLSNDQELMHAVTALVNAQPRLRAASRVLKTWITASLFTWLCAYPERTGSFDENMRLLAWDSVGSALAYTDWVALVALLTGRARKSSNGFTMVLYHFILSEEHLLAFVQEMVCTFPQRYQCADMMQEWFGEQIDQFFEPGEGVPPLRGMAALVHVLLQQTYTVIAWEHVARAFRAEGEGV